MVIATMFQNYVILDRNKTTEGTQAQGQKFQNYVILDRNKTAVTSYLLCEWFQNYVILDRNKTKFKDTNLILSN